MTNERQKKVTDQYRDHWDDIFNQVPNIPIDKDELTSEEARELLDKLNIPFGK
jgi:hypothetical protein